MPVESTGANSRETGQGSCSEHVSPAERMSSSVQRNGTSMGLPVFSSTRGAAGTTEGAATGGRSCAQRAPHANRSDASFRIARKGYLIMTLASEEPVTSSVTNVVFFLNPRYDSGRTHPYQPNAPATPKLGWLLVEHTFKERRAEVALGAIGQHGDNRLTGEFR